MKEINKLRPFTKFCCTIGQLPSSYMVSLSYEEQLMWLCNYLEKTVIPTVNTNAEAVEELQNLFITLKSYVDNYFNNLDVQEEINNKLDEMVESGQLQEIISEYLNTRALFTYNSINDMKNATNLINGSYAYTTGYRNSNDGGNATYLIRTITNEDFVDEKSIIAMSNTSLVAELIKDNVNLMQFGCYGDGVNDDYQNLTYAINYAKENNLKVISPKNKTYLILNSVDISNVDIDFNKSIIKTTENIDMLIVNSEEYYGNYENLKIDMNNVANTGLRLVNSRYSNFNNINIINVSNTGIYYFRGYGNNFNQVNIQGTDANSIGIDLLAGDSNFSDIYIQDCVIAIQTTNVLNKFARIHAWIGTSDFYPNSIMFNVKAKAIMFMDQIYSDTYRYFINTANNVQPIIKVNELCTQFADWIYTQEIDSYIVHTGTNEDTGAINITNSFIVGLENKDVYLSNKIYMGILENNTYSYLHNIDGINKLSFTLPETFTSIANNIYKNGNTIQIQLVFQVNTSNLSSRWITLAIPNYAYKPKTTLNDIAYINNSTTIHNKETLTPISVQIQGQNVSGSNLTLYVPDNMSGNVTVRMNINYVKNV